MDEEIKYTYPVEELDAIIEKMMNGVQPMLSDAMQAEVQMRYKQRNHELGTDSEPASAEEARLRNEMMKRRIAADKRKATRTDALVLTITEEQKAKIREQMSKSIVRSNPYSPYNKTVEEVYSDEQRRSVMEKLKGLKNCSFTQADYKNAMLLIVDAIEASLGKYGDSDYPWLTYEEAVREFNAGKIKFTYCEAPKLYINYSTIMSDPEILRGVVTGDVILKDRNEKSEAFEAKHRKNSTEYKPVTMEYTIDGDDTNEAMINAHYAGYDTPVTPFIRASSHVYNPAAMPINSRFAKNTNSNKIKRPLVWDWSVPGAGLAYYRYIHGIKPKNSDVIEAVKSGNPGQMINTELAGGMNDFLKALRRRSTGYAGYDYNIPNFAQPPIYAEGEMPLYNQNAADIEKALLDSITINSPIQHTL